MRAAVKAKIEAIDQKVAQLRDDIDKRRKHARALYEHGLDNHARLADYFAPRLKAASDQLQKLLKEYPVSSIGAWEDESWT